MAIFASDNFADSFTQSFLPIRTPNRGCPHIMSAAGGGGGGKPNADDCEIISK